MGAIFIAIFSEHKITLAENILRLLAEILVAIGHFQGEYILFRDVEHCGTSSYQFLGIRGIPSDSGIE